MPALFRFAECNADGLRPPVAPQSELDRAPRGNFMDHASKLRRPFDTLPGDFRDDVFFPEARLGSRAVWNYAAQNYAALRGDFQLLGDFAGYLVQFDTEPAGSFFI